VQADVMEAAIDDEGDAPQKKIRRTS